MDHVRPGQGVGANESPGDSSGQRPRPAVRSPPNEIKIFLGVVSRIRTRGKATGERDP